MEQQRLGVALSLDERDFFPGATIGEAIQTEIGPSHPTEAIIFAVTLLQSFSNANGTHVSVGISVRDAYGGLAEIARFGDPKVVQELEA
jgi:hypothetical protein